MGVRKVYVTQGPALIEIQLGKFIIVSRRAVPTRPVLGDFLDLRPYRPVPSCSKGQLLDFAFGDGIVLVWQRIGRFRPRSWIHETG